LLESEGFGFGADDRCPSNRRSNNLKEYELNLKGIYAQIAATTLPTPEQIQKWDALKEINRINIERIRQSIDDLE
jgi:hypothetical protein